MSALNLQPVSLDDLPSVALSVRQPWAWAVIFGGKDVENRDRAPAGTSHRIGRRFTVHAAKGMTRQEYESARSYMDTLGVECPRPDRLVYGGVIGSVCLTDVVSERPSRWFFGPRGLVLHYPRPVFVDELKPSRGQLGWFHWRDGIHGAEWGPIKPWMQDWPHKVRKLGPRARRLSEDLFTAGADDA